ncbi:hypothetical protein CLV58_12556 [Spirosoma oryzae]|uniref:Uncharacterized protein n=1 Tax=Spirosoma oryzae TaxID=1469603 RepID=A0A2T0S8N3_9BACT|nr:hypothetical protein [Spirosoma oryzae]PRY29794.1 hypothetical protein CLV58_12556 [Spirosoma oryzae]
MEPINKPTNVRQAIWWTIKCLLGLGSIRDGSICWFSRTFFDVHDYPLDKGGSGYPDHFFSHQCPSCNKSFFI